MRNGDRVRVTFEGEFVESSDHDFMYVRAYGGSMPTSFDRNEHQAPTFKIEVIKPDLTPKKPGHYWAKIGEYGTWVVARVTMGETSLRATVPGSDHRMDLDQLEWGPEVTGAPE